MKNRLLLLVLAGVITGALTWWTTRESTRPPAPAPRPTIAADNQEVERPDATVPNATQAIDPIHEPMEPTPEEAPVARSNDRVFQTDASGNLVLNQQTRLNIEAMLARTDPEDHAEAAQEAIAGLPPAAALQAADVIARYRYYQAAQRTTYPPGVAPSTEEEALTELDGLHALRVAHFGEDIARRFYEEEEATARRLIELMRLEKDQSLTMEEKAIRAQQMYDSTSKLDP